MSFYPIRTSWRSYNFRRLLFDSSSWCQVIIVGVVWPNPLLVAVVNNRRPNGPGIQIIPSEFEFDFVYQFSCCGFNTCAWIRPLGRALSAGLLLCSEAEVRGTCISALPRQFALLSTAYWPSQNITYQPNSPLSHPLQKTHSPLWYPKGFTTRPKNQIKETPFLHPFTSVKENTFILVILTNFVMLLLIYDIDFKIISENS